MNAELMLRAAACYARAGWAPEACRCYERSGHHAEAARLYQARGLWAPAAGAYALASAWRDAARCYLQAGEPGPAAECLLKAGETLEAAWILAEDLHRFQRARVLVRDLETDSATAAATRELVLARCEAGLKEAEAGARRLRRVIGHLGELDPGPGRERSELRAVAVARGLRRPDLQAQVHAAAENAGIHGAAERWEAWAVATLGDASGVPVDEGERLD